MRRGPPFLLGILLALLPGCAADPFGAPPRVKTHGYRARATLKSDGVEKAAFDLAVFRDLRRKGPVDGPALIRAAGTLCSTATSTLCPRAT